MPDEPRKPFWGKCGGCSHCWPVAYLPMEMTAAAKLMRRVRCPNCAGTKIFVAKQDDGVLKEEAA